MIVPRLFLIYQAFKEKYDMILEEESLQIKSISIVLVLNTAKTVLRIYSNRAYHSNPEHCFINLDTLEIIPIDPPINKKEAINCITLGYVIKEILKPNSIKFIESL